MMNSGPTAALQFLIDTLFDFYSYIILARLILQIVRSDFYNPISQFVVKATNPIVVPLRRVIPGFGGVDNSCIVLLLVIQLLKWLLIGFVINGQLLPFLQLLLLTLTGTVGLVLGFFLFTIFLQVILSWVAPATHNPMTQVLRDITEPLLAPARRVIPPIGGLDLSPMVVMLALITIKKLFGI